MNTPDNKGSMQSTADSIAAVAEPAVVEAVVEEVAEVEVEVQVAAQKL